VLQYLSSVNRFSNRFPPILSNLFTYRTPSPTKPLFPWNVKFVEFKKGGEKKRKRKIPLNHVRTSVPSIFHRFIFSSMSRTFFLFHSSRIRGNILVLLKSTNLMCHILTVSLVSICTLSLLLVRFLPSFPLPLLCVCLNFFIDPRIRIIAYKFIVKLSGEAVVIYYAAQKSPFVGLTRHLYPILKMPCQAYKLRFSLLLCTQLTKGLS